jgi:hypothetical protein
MKKLFFMFLMLILVVGLAAGYVFYAYHVVQDDKGIHLLKKKEAELNLEIVDTRDWKVTDWLKNSEISKGMAQLRWENFREEAENSWNKLKDSISETFDSARGDDSWSDDLSEEWDDLQKSAKQKYEDLRDDYKDGKLDREAFDRKIDDLRNWAERQMEELQERLSK